MSKFFFHQQRERCKETKQEEKQQLTSKLMSCTLYIRAFLFLLAFLALSRKECPLDTKSSWERVCKERRNKILFHYTTRNNHLGYKTSVKRKNKTNKEKTRKYSLKSKHKENQTHKKETKFVNPNANVLLKRNETSVIKRKSLMNEFKTNKMNCNEFDATIQMNQ